MSNSPIAAAKYAVKHWYLLLFVGLIFIVTGIWVALTPISAYLTLSILFGMSFLVSGLIELIFSIVNRSNMKGWGWTLVYGLFNLLIGVILFCNPLLSITTLPLYVGYVVLFRSISAIGISLDRENYGPSRSGGLLVSGVFGLLFSFILLWNPGFAGLTLVVWTAIALITAGFYNIFFSFKLKKLN